MDMKTVEPPTRLRLLLEYTPSFWRLRHLIALSHGERGARARDRTQLLIPSSVLVRAILQRFHDSPNIVK